MKYYCSQNLIKFTWDQVSSAFWNRYPNPYSTHVLTEDTVQQEIKSGKLHTKRLLTKTNHLPKWGERFVPGPRLVCVVEESVVDPASKSFMTYTRNLGYRSIMCIEEKCVYQPSKTNTDWTECSREAWISSSVFGFSYALQTFGYERFKQNAKKSLKGFNHVLKQLFPIESIVSTQSNADVLRSRAKAATELAKSKAAHVVATN